MDERLVRKIAMTGWLILFSLAIDAQEIPFISHFSVNDYQGLNQNWSLGQSSEGFLFLQTRQVCWCLTVKTGGNLSFQRANYQISDSNKR